MKGSFWILATVLLLGCGSPATPSSDAGGEDASDASRPDAFRIRDAGADVFSLPDARSGCEGEGCRIVELALGFSTSCARRQNGEVLCWGRGQNGELGDGNSRHSPGCLRLGTSERIDCSDHPVRVALPGPARRLHARGGFDFCAELEGGAFHCWGSFGYTVEGEMERVRFAPEPVPWLSGAQSYSSAFTFACWLDGEGKGRCIGSNQNGQLGHGDFMVRIQPVHVRIQRGAMREVLSGLVEIETSKAFGSTACARSTAELYCWGRNHEGQLGRPGPHERCISGIEEFDCSSLAVALDFPMASMIRDLAFGSSHACALLMDGSLYCWGSNRRGELGLGTPGSPDMRSREMPTRIDSLSNVAEVELGARHSCARKQDGSVWCWGANDLGQLGSGMEDHPGPQCMSEGMVIDCSSVPVQVVGITDAVELAVGREHSCVVRSNGEVWCWGSNEHYECGSGERQPLLQPQRVIGL
ncbi:MAG: hypothetical protein NZM37_03120 [Sandaracinaceae bacterium]|nr:hypothetical protein [Sandaracinaceae bacterium]